MKYLRGLSLFILFSVCVACLTACGEISEEQRKMWEQTESQIAAAKKEESALENARDYYDSLDEDVKEAVLSNGYPVYEAPSNIAMPNKAKYFDSKFEDLQNNLGYIKRYVESAPTKEALEKKVAEVMPDVLKEREAKAKKEEEEAKKREEEARLASKRLVSGDVEIILSNDLPMTLSTSYKSYQITGVYSQKEDERKIVNIFVDGTKTYDNGEGGPYVACFFNVKLYNEDKTVVDSAVISFGGTAVGEKFSKDVYTINLDDLEPGRYTLKFEKLYD